MNSTSPDQPQPVTPYEDIPPEPPVGVPQDDEVPSCTDDLPPQ